MLVEDSEPITLGKRIGCGACLRAGGFIRANVRYLQVHQQPEAKLLPRREKWMQNNVVGCEARLAKDFQTASSVKQTCCTSVLLLVLRLDCWRSNINLAALQGPKTRPTPNWKAQAVVTAISEDHCIQKACQQKNKKLGVKAKKENAPSHCC